MGFRGGPWASRRFLNQVYRTTRGFACDWKLRVSDLRAVMSRRNDFGERVHACRGENVCDPGFGPLK
ncbi:hypothetical protein AMATHDRAFT_60115 [Amanita thiersii Skay4041]|uniref:Uncharacterized protein n=1 Tax=Amanita thiersii Skay4041 TaxID=703135 RepID=A0A2A9NIX7_9AGAR|nr:hypothetical protein AMATHDRAFT_60115 [Amanita thiersii Skay4041]